jgi:hypothetical protein
MNHSKIELKAGDILICRGHRLISKLIRWATKSKYNHAAIFLEIWGQKYVMDSSAKGTNLVPFEEWEKIWNFEYIVYRNPNLKAWKKFSIRALSKSGSTAYDFASLLIRQPLMLLGRKWKYKGDKENEKMYCSEYTAWCHKIEHSYKMSPQDLLEYCKEHYTLIKK